MVIFLLQLRDTLIHHRLYLFTIFLGVTWLVWLWKAVLSALYQPVRAVHRPTASVVIPVVDEPLPLFRDVLRRIVSQRPDEIIVVINGPRNEPLEEVCASFPEVDWTWTEQAGKRNAIRVGVERSRGEITVLVDSDTIWTPDTLGELLKPFGDPGVGGVTTNQRILAPERHVLTRWADWMESVRSCYSMPAMSVLGTVGCLPGRTIALRRHIIVEAMPTFLEGRFLGVFLEVSDDRTLTNEALKQGYRTVFQSTSVVYTDAPTGWRKMAKQQYRWSRGSQYNTLRMLPWMLRHSRTLACFYLADILLPFLLLGTVSGWVYRAATGTDVNLFDGIVGQYGQGVAFVVVICLTVGASVASAAIRQARHLRRRPSDFWRLPAFLVISTMMLIPIRLLGFVRMAHAGGWGTRAGGYQGERRRNPRIVLPYAAGLMLVVAGTAYHF